MHQVYRVIMVRQIYVLECPEVLTATARTINYNPSLERFISTCFSSLAGTIFQLFFLLLIKMIFPIMHIGDLSSGSIVSRTFAVFRHVFSFCRRFKREGLSIVKHLRLPLLFRRQL